MKLTPSKSLILGSLLVIILILGYLALSTTRLSNLEYLTSSIKEEKALIPSTYTYKVWTTEAIEKMVLEAKPHLKEKELKGFKERLEKQDQRVVFFYLNKSSIEYFISAEVKDKEKDGYCRLVVRNNFFLMTWLNKLGILVKENRQEHHIDKSICNALYGFGKPVL